MTSKSLPAFKIFNAGMLSLIQDAGRFGQARLGLTTGGPADELAFMWANRLLGNPSNSSTLEITMGGLQLESLDAGQFCITGAKCKVSLNNTEIAQWRSYNIAKGDILNIDFASAGCRIYLAVGGGFSLTPQLNSSATVVREGIGGFDGKPLKANQVLERFFHQAQPLLGLRPEDIPDYSQMLQLRLVKGYQYDSFESLQKARFFSNSYKVSQLADRMGYRLTGAAIEFHTRTMLSEGIAQGAVQIPADGQPIVLGKDRQTIGGYPKIGSVLSLDLSRLMQTTAGATVEFTPITIEEAHNQLHLARAKFNNTTMQQYAE